jgi:peptidoglycan/xylan/chitin deacetylase (PgdA/CDA1 family)
VLIQIAATGMAATLAAGGCAYAANWPTSQIFGKTIVAGRDPREVALTFDDGPNGDLTLRLLDVLAKHEVKASFFMIGDFVKLQPAVVRAVHDAGHLIGNHTMTHPGLLWLRPASVYQELTGCNRLIEDATGQAVRYFRPPYGARRPDILKTARSLGLTPVMWNVTCYDWNPGCNSNFILRHARKGHTANQREGRGSNILLHDGGHGALGTDRNASVTATDTFLSELRRPPLKRSHVRFITPESWT